MRCREVAIPALFSFPNNSLFYRFVNRNKQCLSALCHASAILFVWVFWVRSRPRFLHSDLLSSCDVILILHSDWLSGLEKKEASMFEMALVL